MTEEPPEEIRKSRKRWLWGAALFLALFLVACVSQQVSGWWKLSRLKAELREQGEVLDVKELAGAPIPESENCAADLDNLLSDLAEVPGMVPLNPIWVHPQPRRYAGSNVFVVAWQWDAIRHEDFDDKVTYFSWQSLDKALKPARAYLEEIPGVIDSKRYAAAVYDRGTDEAVDYEVYKSFRAARKWLLSASLLGMHKGDRATARRSSETLLDLIRITQNERLMITQLFRQAAGNLGSALMWELLAAKDWDDEALRSLQEKFAAVRFAEPMMAALTMERAMNVNGFERFRISDEAWDAAVGSMNNFESVMGVGSPGGFYRSRYHRFAWRLMWSELDEHRALVSWNEFVDASREGFESWESKATRERLEALSSGNTAMFGFLEESAELGRMDAARFLFSHSVSSTAESLVRTSLQAEAMKNLACCALALERWRIRHGEYPDSLGKLDSLLDTKVMVDPLGAGAMKYRRNEDGSYLLYSSGLDGMDNGGDSTTEDEEVDPFWLGRDMVWPGHPARK